MFDGNQIAKIREMREKARAVLSGNGSSKDAAEVIAFALGVLDGIEMEPPNPNLCEHGKAKNGCVDCGPWPE